MHKIAVESRMECPSINQMVNYMKYLRVDGWEYDRPLQNVQSQYMLDVYSLNNNVVYIPISIDIVNSWEWYIQEAIRTIARVQHRNGIDVYNNIIIMPMEVEGE